MKEAATERSSRFRPSKSCKEVSKSTQCKDKWAVDVFRNWQAACEKKIPLLELRTGAPNDNIFQNHLNIQLLNYFGI